MSIRKRLEAINAKHDSAKRAFHAAQVAGDGDGQGKFHREMLDAEEQRYTLRNEIKDVFLFMLRVANTEAPDALASALAATGVIAKLEAFMVQQKHKEKSHKGRQHARR